MINDDTAGYERGSKYSELDPLITAFLHENICCGYSLDVPHRGAPYEYPQHMFLLRNKKNINTFG